MAQQPPERIAGQVVSGGEATGTPPDKSHGGFKNLGLRLRSAAIFAPPVFAAVYFGSPWFDILVIAAALLMAWEWARMCSGGRFTLVGWAMESCIAVCLLALYVNQLMLALVVAAVAACLAGLVAVARRHESPARIALGAVLISLFCLAFLWIRSFPGAGLELVVWLVLAVWFTDAGGYFFGRTIGGPKLAPRISPNKTWAGLAGGILLAVIWSCIWLVWQGGQEVLPVVAAAFAIAVLAQAGDLSVSAVKRRFGVKDTGGLIPGHGGILDRLDGMLLTGPATAFVLVLSGKGWI
jgi:phosphatidate cytidylyltransferase